MPKIDLITGFLGSGKTTFIRRYAEFLISKGERVGILENDFGAVNVDTMLLSDIESEKCGLEMISGGCCQEPAAHRRRFGTKLIAMRMDGYDRVIVEPSGIYEVDEFFDTLRDEPLDRWYEIGNVISLVDAHLEDGLPSEAEYLLASQISCAGAVVITKSGGVPQDRIDGVISHLNRALSAVRCIRTLGEEVICRDNLELTPEDFEELSSCGYRLESCEKTIFDPDHAFDSLFYMHPGVPAGRVGAAVKRIFEDDACGNVMRVKGFLRATADSAGNLDIPAVDEACGGWIEINATPSSVEINSISRGQEIIIVTGQNLDKGRIGMYLN